MASNETDQTLRPAGEIDLRELGAALWLKRLWIIVPTVAVAALALLTVSRLTPLYKAEARVLLESLDNVYTRPGGLANTEREPLIDEQAVESQVQLTLSRDLGRTVIGKTKLHEVEEFNPLAKGIPLVKRVLVMLGLVRDPLRMSAEERTLQRYFERLEVYPVGKSRVLAITFASEDADLSARIANVVAGELLNMQRAAKEANTRNATAWLGNEIASLRGRVETAEARVEEFRAGSNLFTGSNNASLSTQQLGELNSELAKARTQQSDAHAKAQALREAVKVGRANESLDIANSELMRRLAEQRVLLRATLAREQRTYLSAHPRIKELNAQIADLDEQMRQEALKLARGYEAESRLATDRVASIQASLDAQKKVAAGTNEEEVQLRALEREARAQRDLLEQFLARYRDATARESMEVLPADARIISRASVPSTPYFPKPVPILLIAALGTFLLASGVVAAGELMRGPSSTADTAPRPVRALDPLRPMPAPSRLPATDTEAEPAPAASAPPPAPPRPPESPAEVHVPPVPGALEVFGKLKSAYEGRKPPATPEAEIDAADARLVGRLASRLAEGAGQDGALDILVVAASGGVDSGAIALSLARSLSDVGRKAVIVDVAGESEAIAGALAPTDTVGLGELIAGKASFAEAIHRDRASAVHVVPHGTADMVGAMEAQRFDVAFEALGLTYDFVLLVTGAADSSERLRINQRCGAAILVSAEAANDPATVAAHRRLTAEGIEDVIVLLASPAPGRGSRASASA